MTGARGYALCTTPRSGSNWLGQLLAGTGRLGRPFEAFNGPGRRLLIDPAYPLDPVEQIRRVLADGSTPNGVYALKVFPNHLDEAARHVRWTASLPDLRFAHLSRRDVLGQALSWHRAEQTLQFRATFAPRGEARYDGPRIRALLNAIVAQQARWELFFARNAVQPLRLVYEEILREPQAACNAVAGLVGVAPPVHFDPAAVDLRVQRDALTEEWRERFHAQFADRDTVDTL